MNRRFSYLAVLTVVALIMGVLIEVGQARTPRRSRHRGRIVAVPAKPKKVQRFGAVIGLKPEKKDYYNELHANPWPEINALLKKANIRNYSIYEGKIDGKLYLFASFEYTGNDFKADMAKMAVDPKMKEWWVETDPCQIRLPGTPDGEQWLPMEEVYRLD